MSVAPPVPTTVPETPDTSRLSWPVLGAVLIAFLMCHLTAGFHILTVVFLLGILASYFTRARLEGQTLLRWWIRLALLLIVLALNQEDPRFGEGIGNVRSRNIFGQVYMGEIMIQCWRHRSYDPYRSRLFALILSGLLFLIGSNTFETTYIRWLTPIYTVFLCLGLYEWRNRIPSRGRSVGPRVAAIAGSLLLGFGFYSVIYANKASLTEWGNRFIVDRVPIIEVGMMAQPTLGMMFGLRGSAARVLRIEEFTGDDHLRGMAFDDYSSGRWSPTFTQRDYKQVGDDLRPQKAESILNSRVMRITRVMNGAPLIYAPLNAAIIDTGDVQDVKWSFKFGGPISTNARAPYEYSVTVPPADQPRYADYQGLLANRLTPETRERCLQLPEYLRDEIGPLATRITQRARNDRQKVDMVVAYLLQNHQYSLNYRPGKGDAVSDFLLSEPKKAAHCEFFGSSSALLLRCVGVPSRYVTGYFAHERDGKYTVVRQRDAHAWCEAWIEGVGWVTVEATPGDGRPDANDESVEWWRRFTEWVQDSVKAVTDWIGDLGQNAVNLVIGLIFMVGVAYGIYAYMRRRRRVVGPIAFQYEGADQRLTTLAARFEAAFATHGAPIPAQKTYMDHLYTLSQSLESRTIPDSWLDTARTFVRTYDEARFGGHIEDVTLKRMEESLRELEKAPTS